MGSTLKLSIDRQNRRLITPTSFPDLFQSNIISLQVQVFDPAPTTLQPPTIVDLSAYGLRAAVGSKPTGASGGPTPLALQNTFVWDATNKWFTADLALNVAAIDSYIGALDSIQAWFELNLTLAGDRTTILQTVFTLRAVVDEGTSTAPSPADVYLTKAETLALLAAKLDRIMKSPAGTWARELGIADDGTPTDSIGPV